MAEPKIITKIGTVIEPMNEDVLVATANHKSDLEDDDRKTAGKGNFKNNRKKRTWTERGANSKSVAKSLKKKK